MTIKARTEVKLKCMKHKIGDTEIADWHIIEVKTDKFTTKTTNRKCGECKFKEKGWYSGPA